MAYTFGLRNQKGSCWVNACLQALYRIPDLQERIEEEKMDTNNPVEMCLEEIWNTKGEEGLKSFYECVKTKTMPAGDDIGDCNELLEFLTDKVPFLDKLMRFKVVNEIVCKACKHKEKKNESMIEFSIAPEQPKQNISETIVDAVRVHEIDGWKCDKCGKKEGCSKQMLMSSAFPQILTFHVISPETSVSYSSFLTINKVKYVLFAVICYDGGHWWTYGRDMPPGKEWYCFNDRHVQSFDPTHFPLSDSMRLLMYYRLKE